VTDFLDLSAVIDASREKWHHAAKGGSSEKSILIADPSAFSRGMMRSGLDMAGYLVVEAANMDEVTRKLEERRVDVVVSAHDLPPDGSSALLSVMRRRPGWEGIPVLEVADSAGDFCDIDSAAFAPQGRQLKFDRVAILEAVAQLVPSTAKTRKAPAFGEEKR
jgi:CheY-like chemotaxis protein